MIYQEATQEEKDSRGLEKWYKEAERKKPSKSVVSSPAAQRVTLTQSPGELWGHPELEYWYLHTASLQGCKFPGTSCFGVQIGWF